VGQNLAVYGKKLGSLWEKTWQFMGLRNLKLGSLWEKLGSLWDFFFPHFLKTWQFMGLFSFYPCIKLKKIMIFRL